MDSLTEARQRWYRREEVPGAEFSRGGIVEIADGKHAGERAEVIALERLDPPTYLLSLSSGRNLMVLERSLRRLS